MTRSRPTQARRPTGLSLVSHALFIALLMAAAGAAAEPRPLDARVVWFHEGRVYIAAPDSLALAPGDLVTFLQGKKRIASGEVTERLARDLVSARVTQGSLARVRLERVRLMAERLPVRALPLLRAGYPARANLLFDCGRPVPRAGFLGGAYRADSLAENAYRLVRLGMATNWAPWPDTILVRFFREAIDQEIAFERGEIDVAVFWPGEASRRLRSDAGILYGSRTRGLLAGLGTSIAPASNDPVMAALNEQLFRGDLWPLRQTLSPHWPDSAYADPAAHVSDHLRFDVDSSCAGKPVLQRFLDRMTRPRADARAIRLACFDSSFDEIRSQASPIFAVRCVIAVAPELRAHVDALGADALADLIDCSPQRRTP